MVALADSFADDLIEQHLSVAKRTASRAYHRTPQLLTYDELESAALMGLVHAARDFDASLGVPFEAYAYKKCSYAIADWMREHDHLKRSQRDRGMDTRAPSSIDAEVDDWSPVSSGLAQAPQAIRADTREQLHRAINGLDGNERTVVELVHLYGLSLREAGEVLGVSESRACQIRSCARRRLRGRAAEAAELSLPTSCSPPSSRLLTPVSGATGYRPTQPSGRPAC